MEIERMKLKTLPLFLCLIILLFNHFEALAYNHTVIIRVVRVTEDWMSFSDLSGWDMAAAPKVSNSLKYFDVAIWEETSSIHLYEFPNSYVDGYGAFIASNPNENEKIAYREQYLLQKFDNMPDMKTLEQRDARSEFIKTAFQSFLNTITDRFVDSSHGLIYSGHGGPGGALFEMMIAPKHAQELLLFWSNKIGEKLAFVDMGGPCNKGSYNDLITFCSSSQYYIASDLSNGGYTFDDWTYDRSMETSIEYRYHDLIASNSSLEQVLIKRIDLKRTAYEYSINNMTETKTEQSNYLYSCENFMDLYNEIEALDRSFAGYIDLFKAIEGEGSEIITTFNSVIVHKADNRDFFSWEINANGILSPADYFSHLFSVSLIDVELNTNQQSLTSYYHDYDGDGYGDPNTSQEASSQPSGYVTDNTDCDDYDSSIYPGATEIRGDGIDQDCNGSDLPYLNTYYQDSDGDGYGDPDNSMESASQPSGYVLNNTDCDDYDSTIHPGATEIRGDGIDQDCNGSDLPNIDPDVAAFITRFYQQCLSREPDTGGLEYWADSLSDGDKTGSELAEAFVFSEEFENQNTPDSEFVTILYRAFFNREPDTGGYSNWMNSLSGGISRSSVLDGFTSAQEFKNLCEDYGITATSSFTNTDTSVAGFVTRFYQQCLSREPDTSGLNHWVNSLNDGTKTGAELAESFVFSEEFQNSNTSDSEFVTILYKAFFNREPDTGGYNNWINKMSDGSSRSSVLNGFTSAQEFSNLCEEYNISAN